MSQYATPLRYPGGKQRISPFIVEVLQANRLIGGHYVEPYAGGAGVAIELLLNGHVNHIHLNDSCFPLYAFWVSVITTPEELCRRIRSATLNVEEWKRQRSILRSPEGHDLLDVGFSLFYLNRCNRSGILSGGIIGGLAQSGKWKMDARFSRNGLIQRIEAISSKRDRITLRNLDAEQFIQEYIAGLPGNTLVYCDPPYFEKSGKLYLDSYNKGDHARIAQIIQTELHHKWLVSYDNAEEIRSHYQNRRSFVYNLQYNAAEVYKGTELFVFSDDVVIPRSSRLECMNIPLNVYQATLFDNHLIGVGV